MLATRVSVMILRLCGYCSGLGDSITTSYCEVRGVCAEYLYGGGENVGVVLRTYIRMC